MLDVRRIVSVRVGWVVYRRCQVARVLHRVIVFTPTLMSVRRRLGRSRSRDRVIGKRKLTKCSEFVQKITTSSIE
jgi:hypothetical protein